MMMMMSRKYRVQETEPTYVDWSVLGVMHLFEGWCVAGAEQGCRSPKHFP